MTPSKSPEEMYEEKEGRVRTTIQLQQPDRVPVLLGMAYFPGKYTNTPTSAAYYDPPRWNAAYKKTIIDMDPDLYRAAYGTGSGKALEILGTNQYAWPGYNLPDTSGHQYVEGEYMKEDEYDMFLHDHSDFLVRRYLPRVWKAMAPLAELPPLRMLSGAGLVNFALYFTDPEFQQMAQLMAKAGEETEKFRDLKGDFDEEMAELGYPAHSTGAAGVGGAPFDEISDFYRGMKGSMVDMYRRPDQLLAACDFVLNQRIKSARPANPKARGNPKRLFIALHRGAEGFMSKRQFEKFYWPGLKAALLKSVELGYVPMPFFEGAFGDRLEYLLELPKGKVVAHFEHMDMKKAKDVLGKQICIMGDVPSSLLQVGSVGEVEEYCKNLIQYCGKGGGFILTNGSSIDNAKPENVKAMCDSVKKFRP